MTIDSFCDRMRVLGYALLVLAIVFVYVLGWVPAPISTSVLVTLFTLAGAVLLTAYFIDRTDLSDEAENRLRYVYSEHEYQNLSGLKVLLYVIALGTFLIGLLILILAVGAVVSPSVHLGLAVVALWSYAVVCVSAAVVIQANISKA